MVQAKILPIILAFFLVPVLCSRYFQDHFTVIKWHVVFILILFLLGLLWQQKKWVLPQMGKRESFFFFSTLFVSFGNIFVQRFPEFHAPLLDRLSFVVLTYAFFWLLHKKVFYFRHIFLPILWASLAVYLYALYQMLLPIKYHLYPYMAGVKASSLFGNANMTAQFVGIAVLVQFYLVFARNNEVQLSKKMSKFLLLSLSLGLAYLHYLACRSVILATLPVLTIFFVQYKFWEQKKKVLSLLIMSVVFSIAMNSLRRNEPNVITKTIVELGRTGTDNQNSFYLRLSLWKSSLRLLFKHPMGVGTGATEFNLVPFQIGSSVPADEQMVYNTPHNEYIRYLIEDGAFFTIMAFVFLFLLLKKFLQNLKDTPSQLSEKVLVLGLILYLAIESFFQFPFMNAFPYLISSLLLAYLLQGSFEVIEGSVRTTHKIFLGTIGVILLYLNGGNLYSSYQIANHFEDREKLETACKMFPNRWKSCLRVAHLDMESSRLAEAEGLLSRFLSSNPYNFVALKIMSATQFKLGHLANACFYVYQYDSLFESKSSLHPVLTKNCPWITPEFKLRHPYP